MSFGLLFWILVILWCVFGLWPFSGPREGGWRPMGGTLLLFVLLVLLGWKVFGPPIHP